MHAVLLGSFVATTVMVMIAPVHADVPDWMRTSAEWWADGAIDDGSFTAAVKYLADEGLITVAQCTDLVRSAVIMPQSSAVQCVSDPQDATIRFTQDVYAHGQNSTIVIDLSKPVSETVILGVFDMTGGEIYRADVTTNEFGKGYATFAVPAYYVEDQDIEALAVVEGSEDARYAAHATITALKVSIESDYLKMAQTDNKTTTLKFKLSEHTEKTLVVKVFDYDRNPIYNKQIKTNEYGFASIQIVVPEHLKDRPVDVMVSFADDPSVVHTVSVITHADYRPVIAINRPVEGQVFAENTGPDQGGVGAKFRVDVTATRHDGSHIPNDELDVTLTFHGPEPDRMLKGYYSQYHRGPSEYGPATYTVSYTDIIENKRYTTTEHVRFYIGANKVSTNDYTPKIIIKAPVTNFVTKPNYALDIIIDAFKHDGTLIPLDDLTVTQTPPVPLYSHQYTSYESDLSEGDLAPQLTRHSGQRNWVASAWGLQSGDHIVISVSYTDTVQGKKYTTTASTLVKII